MEFCMQNKKIVFIAIISIVVVFIAGAYIYKQNESASYNAMLEQKASNLQKEHSIVLGKKEAKVQLVEFFDPACGTCAQFHPYVKKIMKENEDDIKLVLRYAPFHENSDFAVRVLEASRKQDKFMDTLEFMFATQKYWIEHHVVNPKMLWRILPKAGLDMEKLSADIEKDSQKVTDIINQDLSDAKELGATKTPSYFVNGKPLETFGLDNLMNLIKSEL
jgi:protein-disulfide isomerase